MSDQVTTAFVKEFEAGFIHLAQQTKSRFEMAVITKTGSKGEETFMDQIGSTDVVLKTGRHTATVRVDTPHSRRRVAPLDYTWADLVDNQDEIRTLTDPSGAYMVAGNSAMQRQKDLDIILAALGTSFTGKTGAVAKEMLASHIIANGATGLTVAKLIQVREILGFAEADDYDGNKGRGDLFIATTPREVSNLLDDPEVTSSDFNTVKALVNGEVNEYMGFTFIRTNQIQQDTVNVNKCIAWHRKGIGFRIYDNIVARLTEESTMDYAMQPYLRMSFGATRLEEERVVQVDTLTTA